MIGIRRLFMDLLYAAVIGNSLQLLDPSHVNIKFFFGIFLLIVILEDFFLYYADVAPENPDHGGLSALGMLSEISVLGVWYFAFSAFNSDEWVFAIYLTIFFLLKVGAGFINCFQTKVLMSLKFARELLFLMSCFVLIWILLLEKSLPPSASNLALLWIIVAWTAQTILWWSITSFFRSKQGQTAILSLETAPHISGSAIVGQPVEGQNPD